MRHGSLVMVLVAGCAKHTQDPGPGSAELPQPTAPPPREAPDRGAGTPPKLIVGAEFHRAEVGSTTGSAAGSGSGAGSAAGSGSGSGSGSLAPPVSSLPRSADVLPADLVGDKESRLFTGDKFRFQVPSTFAAIDHSSKAAYRGTLKGMVDDGELTLWAATEPFGGDLPALIAREKRAIEGAGGKITVDGKVVLDVAGKTTSAKSHRLVGKLADRYDMRILVVHDKRAYIFHCELPDAANAWVNLGSDCMVRGATFNVAPPGK